MGVEAAELIAELKTLRKGRGLFVRQIGERIGPALREVCRVADEDSPAEIRGKVAEQLECLAAGLPDDLRAAVTAAFGIHPDARQPFYQDRVRWVAEHLGRDVRTARRRIDDGIGQLAELAMTATIHDDPQPDARVAGWHTEELWVALVLDQPVPEAYLYRRIVADRDDLTELDLPYTLTAPQGQRDPDLPHDLHVDVFYGGTLVRKMKESADRFGFVLVLPDRLMRNQKHEFALRYRVPEGQAMAPHYVSVLRHRCDTFQLRVRFDRARPPRLVWRLVDAFQRDVDDPVPHGEIISLDSAGEIHETFQQLTPGLAYGVRWENQ